MMLQTAAAKAVATAAMAMVLLGGCGGKDDDSSDSGPGDGATPVPSTPAAFDPPKGFVPVSAFGVARNLKDNQDTVSAGMVGQTALSAGNTGITGRVITAEGKSWTVPAAAGITTSAATTPTAVRLNGKDVVAIAYVQANKAKGQVLFQWIDPADGTKVAEVTADLGKLLGRGHRGNRVQRQAYDVSTGQIAIGVTPGSDATEAKAGNFTVYADPKTRKASVIPFVTPGGVRNGVVAGIRKTASGDTLVLANGATARITKRIPAGFEYLQPVGGGAKRAVFEGVELVESPAYAYRTTLLAVDLVSGSVERIKSPMTGLSGFTCLGDRAEVIVCHGSEDLRPTQLLALDDTTGKKIWGFTEKQRVVPRVTAAFHGVVYAQNGAKPVLLDAATGMYVSTSTPTPPRSTAALSLFDNAVQSPTAVTPYGGVYLQPATGTANYDFETILIALRPTGS
jgi:hypothetical protein